MWPSMLILVCKVGIPLRDLMHPFAFIWQRMLAHTKDADGVTRTRVFVAARLSLCLTLQAAGDLM